MALLLVERAVANTHGGAEYSSSTCGSAARPVMMWRIVVPTVALDLEHGAHTRWPCALWGETPRPGGKEPMVTVMMSDADADDDGRENRRSKEIGSDHAWQSSCSASPRA